MDPEFRERRRVAFRRAVKDRRAASFDRERALVHVRAGITLRRRAAILIQRVIRRVLWGRASTSGLDSWEQHYTFANRIRGSMSGRRRVYGGRFQHPPIHNFTIYRVPGWLTTLVNDPMRRI